MPPAAPSIQTRPTGNHYRSRPNDPLPTPSITRPRYQTGTHVSPSQLRASRRRQPDRDTRHDIRGGVCDYVADCVVVYWGGANMNDDIQRRVMQWMVSGDTGISSETLACKALGIKRKGHFSDDAPYDPADFGRCHRLLQKIPELRAMAFPKLRRDKRWQGLIRNWDHLTDTYLHELPSGSCPILYGMMRKLRGR